MFCSFCKDDESEVVENIELEKSSLQSQKPQPAQHQLMNKSKKKKQQGPRMSVEERDRLARKKVAEEHLKEQTQKIEVMKLLNKKKKKGRRIKFNGTTRKKTQNK